MSKEIGRYEAVTRDKINRKKSVWSAVGFMEGLCSSRPLHLEGRSMQETRCLVQLEKNWSEVLEKVVAAME